MTKKIAISLLSLTLLGCANDFYYENGKKIEVSKIENRDTNHKMTDIKYYKTSQGHKIGVKNDILVECNADVNCIEVLNKYNTLSITPVTDTIFLVKIAKEKNIFEFSQKLYKDSNIKIAHPNFRKEKRRR